MAKKTMSETDKLRAKALRGQPYTEGTWKIGDDWYRVTATLYPEVTWWIQPCDVGGKNNTAPRRLMTAAEGKALKPWL